MNYIDMVAIVRQHYYAVRPLTHRYLRIVIGANIDQTRRFLTNPTKEQLLEDVET